MHDKHLHNFAKVYLGAKMSISLQSHFMESFTPHTNSLISLHPKNHNKITGQKSKNNQKLSFQPGTYQWSLVQADSCLCISSVFECLIGLMEISDYLFAFCNTRYINHTFVTCWTWEPGLNLTSWSCIKWCLITCIRQSTCNFLKSSFRCFQAKAFQKN
jgi:hypothetical protein